MMVIRLIKYFLVGSLRFLMQAISKIWLQKLNRLVVYNKETFFELSRNRAPKRGLITFSNHYSCIDDPLLWGISSWRHIWTISWSRCRWIPTAKEIVFTTAFCKRLFTYARCIPIIRGDGVYQTGMNTCLDILNHGGWIHIFPEGKVNKEQAVMRLKWGIGRLITDSDVTPIVLPMFHQGFDSILPNKKPYKIQRGNDVTVLVGEPVDYTNKVKQLKDKNKSAEEMRKIITDDIQEKFYEMRGVTEHLHSTRLAGSTCKTLKEISRKDVL